MAATPPPKRRGHHEGSFRHRPDGRWEARFYLPSGKRTSVFGKTRAEVRAKMTEAVGKAGKGIDLRAERQTLAAYLGVWLEEVARPKLALSTIKSYESYLNKHIIPELGHVRLGDLAPQDVQAFLNGRTKAKLSPRTVQYLRAILRSALTQAQAWGYVERNAAALARPPRMEKREIQTLSGEEAQRFIAATADDRLGNLFAVALYSGLRQGELLGLRWPDVDLDKGTLRVRKAIQKHGGEWRFVDPKSESSRRTVQLSPAAVAILADQKRLVAASRRTLGGGWQEWGLVFPSQVGTPLDGTNVTKHLQRQLRGAGLPVVTFHALRHTCATLLMEYGIPARVVMDQLGHSQINLTLNTYSHVRPTMLRAAADALERALGG